MLTKQQKIENVSKSKELIQNSRTVVFTDFTGTSVADLTTFRRKLRELGAQFHVIKKRLVKIALQEQGMDVDPTQFEAQVGTIFSDKGLNEIAGAVYAFEKTQKGKGFKILGAYDVQTKESIPGETVAMIGKLPSREVLLGQLVGMFAAPIRMFLYVLQEKSKMVAD